MDSKPYIDTIFDVCCIPAGPARPSAGPVRPESDGRSTLSVDDNLLPGSPLDVTRIKDTHPYRGTGHERAFLGKHAVEGGRELGIYYVCMWLYYTHMFFLLRIFEALPYTEGPRLVSSTFIRTPG